MPKLLYTVDNLIDEIRAQLDEDNLDSVTDTRDILPTLNRAQDYAFDVLARKYPEPLLNHIALPLTGGVAEYDIPENVFEDRIEKIEMSISASSPASGARSTYREVQRISYRDISNYESASITNVPYYYTIFERTIRFVPTPSGTYGARLWYLRLPEKLVKPEGRIVLAPNFVSNYVVLEGVGESLTTETDNYGSYVNIIDGQTGKVKGTMQIQSIVDNKITFRSIPTRTTVLNRTISGSLADLPIPVEPDDYVCSILGTCVPYFGRPTSNFLIQYSVAEITRKLGGEAATEEQILEKFEKQIERTWVGRENTLRIKKRNQNFGIPTRRWFYE